MKVVIQLIRGKVRKSIANKISVSVQRWDIENISDWCPLVFDILIDSKTPARVRLVEINYEILLNDVPNQFGYWKSGMKYETGGLTVCSTAILINGNSKEHFKVSFNPVKQGLFPSDHDKLGMKGVVYIETAYGLVNRPFENMEIFGDKERLKSARNEFNNRYPSFGSNQ